MISRIFLLIFIFLTTPIYFLIPLYFNEQLVLSVVGVLFFFLLRLAMVFAYFTINSKSWKKRLLGYAGIEAFYVASLIGISLAVDFFIVNIYAGGSDACVASELGCGLTKLFIGLPLTFIISAIINIIFTHFVSKRLRK